jgi:methyl-accepting chemotaxis protein
LYNLVASFGSLWLIEHLILFFAVLILGRWVFGYLLKRLTSQLFMIFTCSVLAIFLLTTVTFTYLLLKNLETETLRQLETDVRVLDFAIESKKSESLSDAAVMAQSAQVIKATEEKDHKILFENLQNFLLTKKQSFLAVVDAGGVILARGEDKEKRGDSFSDDPLIKRALSGEAISSVVAKDGVLSSQISVRGVTPIKSGDKIIGAVMAGSIVDSAFIDGIKKATGLEASIYGGNKLSATTLIASDGRSRALGIKEEDSRIKAKVLGRGESFSGSVGILNVPYLGAYLPLKDIDNAPLGMLFVGKRQIVVLQTAGSSIELTFIVAAILMVLSIIPAFMISKYLANQLR